MTFRLPRLVLAASALVLLSACQTNPSPQRLPEISFAAKRPISLDVGQVEIVREYISPARRPNVDHLMQVSPEAAAIRWVQDRIKPMGRTGTARVVIRDAAVVETELRTDKSFSGNFKDQQSERYEGSLDVSVQILDDRHLTVADVVARANRSKTVLESASLNDREKAQHEISEALIKDIDAQLDGLIRSYLSRWVM